VPRRIVRGGRRCDDIDSDLQQELAMTALRSASRPAASLRAFEAEGDCDCDQKIIDARMAGDHELPDLARHGLTAEAVASRADQLRMSAAFVKKCRLSGAQPNMRSCLNCDARFVSAGSHNRLCRNCARGWLR
jgi:hypothetical protein